MEDEIMFSDKIERNSESEKKVKRYGLYMKNYSCLRKVNCWILTMKIEYMLSK